MRPIVAALLLFPCVCASAQAWTPLPDFPGTARDDAASFAIGTDIYVGTGMETGWGLTTDWWRYRAATGEWEQVGRLPAVPRQYAAGFSVDGTGYLFGGYDGTDFLNELWAYDPDMDVWLPRAPLPAPGRRASAAFAFGAYGYIATGLLPGDAPTDECWRYDPATDTWQAMAPVPGPPRQRAAAFVATLPVVVGGSATDDTAYADGHAYDPGTDTWSPIAPLPAPRFWHRAAAGHLVGGASSYAAEHADVWRHDPVADQWTAVDPFAGGARRGGVAQWADHGEGGVLYHGLGFGNGQRHKDWWMLRGPVGVSETDAPRLCLRPNPAADLLHVDGAGHSGEVPYQVLDMLGRRVRWGTLGAERTIALTGLAPGPFVLVLGGGAAPLRVPFIKE